MQVFASSAQVVFESLPPQTFNAKVVWLAVHRDIVTEVGARNRTGLPQEAAQCSLVKSKRLLSSWTMADSPKSCSRPIFMTRVRTRSHRLALYKPIRHP